MLYQVDDYSMVNFLPLDIRDEERYELSQNRTCFFLMVF